MQCASSITSSPTEAANSGSMSSRKRGLLSRSGLISSRSIVSAASRSRTSSHSSRLVLLIVCARSPSRSAAAIWLRISASSGLTISVGPGARLAQQRRRDEVDRRLAPARALDAEHPRAVDDHVADRLELIGPELRRRVPRERAQTIKRRGLERLSGGDGHLHTAAAGTGATGCPAGPESPTVPEDDAGNDYRPASSGRRPSAPIRPLRPEVPASQTNPARVDANPPTSG